MITPLGLDTPSSWQAMLEARSGIGRITLFDPTGFACQIAGEVKGFVPEAHLEPKDARRMDRFVQFAVLAAQEALQDAQLQISADNAEWVGVYIGSGIGGFTTLSDQFRVLERRGPERVSPFLIPMVIVDMAAGQVSISLGAQGPNLGIVSACASGAHAIGEAAAVIARGDAQVMIAGGAEAGITEIGLAGFCAARALSARTEEPERASRPFDRDRDGFVAGEGAGILILESEAHARARGARIYCEVAGYGLSADAFHVTAPPEDGHGAVRSMQSALRRAGLRPEDIDYINAHGTSTPLNDRMETRAIKQVFGEHAHRIPVSSVKSMIGHLLGAAGGVEAVVTVKALGEGVLPPTINYETPDPDCDLDYVPNIARPATVRCAISNNFGFGGHNATLLFRTTE